MTSFVESVVSTAGQEAKRVARRSRGRPTARRLLRALAGRRRVLVTTHMHPDPDALASGIAMRHLLLNRLDGAEVEMSVKGPINGGINAPFTQLAPLDLVEWDQATLNTRYDAVVLLDVQPQFAYSPLPADVPPTVIVDHHSARGRRAKVAFSDIRPQVGATTSIVFSYLLELDVLIDSTLAAALLYAIESDLAGAAGHPHELDNLAISNLTLLADPRRLAMMRNAPLPRDYYLAFNRGITESLCTDSVLTTFLGEIASPEITAVVADFLLRLQNIQWVMVGALYQKRLILSLRTTTTASAVEAMRKLLHNVGEGGGHRTKAGGFVPLQSASTGEFERVRKLLRRRFLKLLGLPTDTRLQKLVPPPSIE